jgi:ankyrin repeat protein
MLTEDPGCLERLLFHKANATAQDQNGLTAVHTAAMHHKDPAIFRLLLGAGLDPNALTPSKVSPL